MSISVIIPVKGRVNYLEKLLKSLAEARKYTPDHVEIIVVDSSDKKTRGKIVEVCGRFQANYHYFQKGLAEARNYGISAAKYHIVFFTDSDCEVDHDIFNQHLKCYNNELIGGCTGLTEFKGKKRRLWNVIEKMPFLQPFQWAKKKNYVPWAPCSNISFRKDVLEKVKGFESMLPPKESGEDVDLGYRITSLGYKISCNPNAIVYHSRETWAKLNQFIERTFRFGRGEYYLMKKHRKNTYLDLPKNSLVFTILLAIFTCIALIKNTLLYATIPFIWLPTVIFIQCIFALKCNLIRGNWKDIGYIYISLIFELLFEFGTNFECIKKGDLKVLFRRFIYIEDQIFGRWHWGIIRMWSYVISLFILILFL